MAEYITKGGINHVNNLRSVNGATHAEALKNEFNSYKNSIPRDSLNTYYSSVSSNGSFYMGYFLSNYNDAPYGGYYVAHYGTPYYVGIAGGTYTQSQLWKQGDTVTGAAWNDYAECREADTLDPGYVLIEVGDDTLTKSTERLQAFAGVSSDTYGFSQGETEKAKTPIGVSGRVLAYYEGDRYDYHAGDTVGAGPEGKIVKMTREEIKEYPDRIIGIVSEIPEYETWGTGNVLVDGRIWIKVK